MKLLLLAMPVFLLVPNHGGELLSPSSPNSVCERKKTSLTGWLPLPQALCHWPHRSSSSPPPSFTRLSSPQLHFSNSK